MKKRGHLHRRDARVALRGERGPSQLDSVYVSREHLRLRSGPEGVRVVPLSPTNPASVNGNPIPQDGTPLADGDLLEIGGTQLSFRTALP